MRLASLISGGKDSLYAMYLAKNQGHEIKYLVSLESENPESYMFHIPNIHLVDKIAENIGLPLVKRKTKGVKEEELKDIKNVLASLKPHIDGITTGAIASNYQKTRIDAICFDLGLASIAPFWGKDPEEVLRGMLRDGFTIMVVAVAAPPLDDKWLGRIIDEKCVDELVALNRKHGIHVMGEGGEMDTLVLICPLYKKRIVVKEAERHWDEKTRSGFLQINETGLADKP
ncbi:MAG: TIGR00289 family protein [Candidatus Aenigmarchaeota archaeon]|nr:TIGR00289 family protein [Candidatus Aenigmarchaeota archaeon]